MDMIVSWLGARLAPMIACVLAVLLAWQSARIDGWPLVGGGLKAQMSGLRLQLAARDADAAKAAWTSFCRALFASAEFRYIN